jgi:site-specific recombinase XerD
MNTFFKDKKAIERMKEGPLGQYVVPYANQLRTEGYAQESGRIQLRLVANFSRWLARKGIPAKQIAVQHILNFLRARKRAGHPSGKSPQSALARLVRLLREQAVITDRTPKAAATPSEILLAEYDGYLQRERALVLSTRINYQSFIRRFLVGKFAAGSVDLSALRAADVIQFVQQGAGELIPKRAQLMTTALRSFLRFAQYHGDLKSNLASCVPSVASWSLSTVPKSLPRPYVKRVLAGCNRTTAAGRRNYAMLLLLARLGLRAGEVANLTLEDIDWEGGCMTVHGKRGRVDQLPLPNDVGRAIAAYLKAGRPQSSGSRRLFLRSKAPVTGFKGPGAVSCVVGHALAEARIDWPRKGAHQFRHALACDLLRQGRSLREIGEILRHRSPQTTALYAKVDLRSLRTLALPWPGGGR